MQKLKRKKTIGIIIIVILVLGFVIVRNNLGNVSDVEIGNCSSKIFTEKEIKSAMKAVKKDFGRNFEGCNLNKLWYDEEINLLQESEGKEKYNKLEISITAEFYIRPGCGDGSMKDDQTYSGYNWILTRESEDHKWIVKDHGYC
ncbi:MAG: hypothetical protein K2F81_06300 [Ruminococcus sp.]|nr:hypothetical protein [Ruminococcus sp.]